MHPCSTSIHSTKRQKIYKLIALSPFDVRVSGSVGGGDEVGGGSGAGLMNVDIFTHIDAR